MTEFLAGFTIPTKAASKMQSSAQWTDAIVGLSHHFAICYVAYDVITKPDESIVEDKLYASCLNISTLNMSSFSGTGNQTE